MKVHIPKGKYVVAVSGGVDSMALLDLLTKRRDLELVVAHFNHGIRPDSKLDEEFVHETAKKHQLPFEAGYGKLGSDASEDKARRARYRFLNKIKRKHYADAVITAHHQDDLIETAILNMLRGTGRRGLTAIIENAAIVRPMLGLSKKDILAYVQKKGLEWREDPTNKDERYLRNYMRQKIMPKLSNTQRRQFLKEIQKLSIQNSLLNQEIEKLSQKIVNGETIDRASFISLPTEIAQEVLMHFLRRNGVSDFDKKTIERLLVAIKTAKAGTKHDVIKRVRLELTPASVLLK